MLNNQHITMPVFAIGGGIAGTILAIKMATATTAAVVTAKAVAAGTVTAIAIKTAAVGATGAAAAAAGAGAVAAGAGAAAAGAGAAAAGAGAGAIAMPVAILVKMFHDTFDAIAKSAERTTCEAALRQYDKTRRRRFFISVEQLKETTTELPSLKFLSDLVLEKCPNICTNPEELNLDDNLIIQRYSQNQIQGILMQTTIKHLHELILSNRTISQIQKQSVAIGCIAFEIEIDNVAAPVRTWDFANMSDKQIAILCVVFHNKFRSQNITKYNKTVTYAGETKTFELPSQLISLSFGVYKLVIHCREQNGYVIEAKDESLFHFFHADIIKDLPGPADTSTE